MELGIIETFHHLEDAITKLTEALMAKQAPASNAVNEQNGNSSNNRSRNTSEDPQGNNEGRMPMSSSKLDKLDFPQLYGDDPTEWFRKVEQFFGNQGTPETQKIPITSFHLQGVANQRWQ